jgi:NodT family efflux transporter outer membrane factor (OMF) lipoprotein
MVDPSLKRLHYTLALFALLLTAGCSVGPNYHPPQAQVPTGWPSSAVSVASIPKFIDPVAAKTANTAPKTDAVAPVAAAPAPVDESHLAGWWNEFNDPELTRLVTEALRCNLDVRRAQMRIVQARASVGIVRSGFFPSASYTNSFDRSRTPITDPQGNINGSFQSLFRHGFDMAWELDIFGGTRRAYEASKAQLQASEEDRHNFLITVAAEVGSDYIAYRSAQREIEIAKLNLELQQKNAGIVQQKQKVGIGVITGLDVANAEAQMATTRATIPVLESAAQQLAYALAVLLGRDDPAALDAELKAGAPIPPPPPAIPVGMPSDLLRRRPDIRQAEANLHAANANIGVAKADLFPKFSLTGSAALQGSKVASLGNLKTLSWGAGPSLTWDPLQGGRIFANIALQKALTEEQCLIYKQTVLGALDDVDNALIAFAKEREHHDALADAVGFDLKAVSIASTLYKDGLTDYLNVIVAQNQLFVAQDQLVQSDRNLSTDIVALYKALGGGWEPNAEILCDETAKR